MQLTKKPAGENAGLMEGVALGAVILSAAVAGIGVAGIVGWQSTLAACGSIALVAGTVFTELAASRLPVQAENRAREKRPVLAALVVSGFIALTAWNVTAGHMGMQAINNAGIADKRRPLVEAAATTEAARVTAEEALASFDARVTAQDTALADSLRGAFASGYVTAGARAIRNTDGNGRETARAELAKAAAKARADDRRAQAALDAAPTGRPDHELWSFALVLELLKGALVWFCTPRRRRVEPMDSAGVITIAPGMVRDMTDEQLRKVLSQARSVSASAQHELRRRSQAAA